MTLFVNKGADKRSGFVALVSVLVIGVLLLAMTFSLSITGFYSRFNVLAVQYKERSLALAEECANIALMKLAADRAYAGDETAVVGSLSCDIRSVTKTATEITVRTSASFPQALAEKAVTNLVIVAELSDLDILSWSEVPNHS